MVKLLFKGLGLVIVALFALSVWKNIVLPSVFPSSAVSVLHLKGYIYTGGPVNIESLEPSISGAFGVKKLKAVCLVINSYGGSAVQSEMIASRIMSLAKRKKVPVYSFVMDSAASGGYWLACAGDEIFAMSSNSTVGSIGVINASFGYVDLLKKLGIERRVYTVGKNKNLFDPYSPLESEHEKIISQINEGYYKTFVDYVTSRRGAKLKQGVELFDGRFWRAEDGLQLGLIDGIQDLSSFIEAKFGASIAVKHFGLPRRPSLLSKMLGCSNMESFLARINSILAQAELDLCGG